MMANAEKPAYDKAFAQMLQTTHIKCAKGAFVHSKGDHVLLPGKDTLLNKEQHQEGAANTAGSGSQAEWHVKLNTALACALACVQQYGANARLLQNYMHGRFR